MFSPLRKSIGQYLKRLAFSRSLSHRSPWSRRPWPHRWAFEQLEDRLLPSAAVFTNKLDYAPGSTALITATGFQPGETIELQVLHIDGKSNAGPQHAPWFVTDGGAGDLDGKVNGQVRTQWFVAADSRNSWLEVTAQGLSSGETAHEVFHDSPLVGSVTVGSQTGSLTTGTGGSVTYLITVTRGTGAGAFTATLSANGLPGGANASFSPSSLSFLASDTTKTATLTVTTRLKYQSRYNLLHCRSAG